MHAQPTLTDATQQTYELTMASSKWGDGFAASHAQLSLVGYGPWGGHWDESALGCFGESITYDPDLALRRAMVDDVRPFLVQSDKKWNWTGNVGGADFLRYRHATNPGLLVRLGRVRSDYRAVGPIVTDVVYAGRSRDGAIDAQARVQMASTDDMVRTYYRLDYRFNKDVNYHTLAFFQVAADRYADNGFAQLAHGNEKGLVFNGKLVDHKKTGYASDKDRGIALSGKAPWVLLYDNKLTGDKLPERFANVGFVVREFRLTAGGKELKTPHINITRTNNGRSQMAFQLGLPHDPKGAWCGPACASKQRFVPKGARLQATVEYLVLPADKSRYYGPNAYLKAVPAAEYKSPGLMRRMAERNIIDATAQVGEVVSTYPVEVAVAGGELAADVTLTGGAGRTAVRFSGLDSAVGWKLQHWVQGAWTTVDQSVHGKDWWQADFDAETKTFTLSYSLVIGGTARFRLLR